MLTQQDLRHFRERLDSERDAIKVRMAETKPRQSGDRAGRVGRR